jgi:hypothetical protein
VPLSRRMLAALLLTGASTTLGGQATATSWDSVASTLKAPATVTDGYQRMMGDIVVLKSELKRVLAEFSHQCIDVAAIHNLLRGLRAAADAGRSR